MYSRGRALVTGSEGFVGRHFASHLQELGYEVNGIDVRAALPEDALQFFRRSTQVYDLVVHAAYHVGGRASIDGKNMLFAQNLALDSAMFDWAVRTRQKKVLYLSSSAAYPKYLQNPDGYYYSGNYSGVNFPKLHELMIKEDEPDDPDANYGWAKLTGERLARTASELGLRVHVVRPFSGYGSDQSLDYPFPSIVKRASQGDLTVWGPPRQTRDWVHIDDVIRGSMAIMEADERRPVNLCTGVPTSMGALARLVYETKTGLEAPDVTYLEDKPTGVLYRVGDPDRFHQYYIPKISVEEGVTLALKGV